MKNFLVWVTLVVLFDGTTCVALRALVDPPPALTLEDAAPTACEQRMNKLDPNLTVAMSNEQLQELRVQLCATPVSSQATGGVVAQPQDILYARRRCPELDSYLHQGMSFQELSDLEDRLCPRPTPTPTSCELALAARIEAPTDDDVHAIQQVMCRSAQDDVLSDPQRTGN